LATPHRSAALAARYNSSITPGRAQFLTRWLTRRLTRRQVRVRIVAFGVADPPHSGVCGLARATAEAVGIPPGPGIDSGAGPGVDPGIAARVGPGVDPGIGTEIDLGRAEGRKDVRWRRQAYPGAPKVAGISETSDRD